MAETVTSESAPVEMQIRKSKRADRAKVDFAAIPTVNFAMVDEHVYAAVRDCSEKVIQTRASRGNWLQIQEDRWSHHPLQDRGHHGVPGNSAGRRREDADCETRSGEAAEGGVDAQQHQPHPRRPSCPARGWRSAGRAHGAAEDAAGAPAVFAPRVRAHPLGA
jgi:hypothetical protein